MLRDETSCGRAGPWTQYDDERGVRTVRYADGCAIAAVWVTHAGAPQFQVIGGPVMTVRRQIQPDPIEAAKLAADQWLRANGWDLDDAGTRGGEG